MSQRDERSTQWGIKAVSVSDRPNFGRSGCTQAG